MRGALIVIVLAVLAGLPRVTLADAEFTILYHESLTMLDVERRADGSSARFEFDAYGRRFVLLVEHSEPAHFEPGVERIEGRLSGAPGSWARLTRRGEELSGLIRDGDTTYVVEPRRVLEADLMLADRGGSPNVIYRLEDTLVAPGALSCDSAHETAPIDGKSAFAGLTAELSTSMTLAATDESVATVGVLADYSFYDRNGAESVVTIESMFLTVDGIYSEQVGISIELVDLFVATTAGDDPLSGTRDASALLNELAQWRVSNQAQYALTHLVTNRRIYSEREKNDQTEQADIAGISFLGAPGRGGVCDARTGASISEWMTRPMTALIIAHEIGHNFGAPHDGEIPKPGETPNMCIGEPPDTYLMSPMISSTRVDTFSQCSIEQMSRVIAAASCIQPISEAGVVLSGQAGIGQARGGGSALDWPTVLALASFVVLRHRRRAHRR